MTDSLFMLDTNMASYAIREQDEIHELIDDFTARLELNP